MPTVVVIFGLVYLGMLLGRLPRLQLDRTGVALLGAIALLASGELSLEEAGRALDVPTLALLFALMVVSAQLRLGGFYARVTRAFTGLAVPPAALLALLVGVVGALSAVFSNDIVCLAVAPVLIDACARRRLDPLPFLLALACAANVGSAATLIGNPQNILIGQSLGLSFGQYALEAGPVALLGLAATWVVIALSAHGRFDLPPEAAAAPRPGRAEPAREIPPFNRWQSIKGLGVASFLLVAFLATSWPREIVALAGAGALLTSRRLHSREMLGLVDWQLLVLFIGLFVVNHAFERTGLPEALVAQLGQAGMDPSWPPWLFGLTVLLSNAVSNVPAVMLLLPFAGGPEAGPLLALASTLAGNLLLVGSIANLIVVDAAARQGIAIDWHQHARIGVPVTVATLLIAAGFLWLRAHGSA